MGTAGGGGGNRRDGTVPGTPSGGEEFTAAKHESPTGPYKKRERIKERSDQSIKEFLSDPYAMATLEPGEAGPNGAEGGRFSVSPVGNERPGSGAMGRLDFHSNVDWLCDLR